MRVDTMDKEKKIRVINKYKPYEDKIKQLLIKNGYPHHKDTDIDVTIKYNTAYIGVPEGWKLPSDVDHQIMRMLPFTVKTNMFTGSTHIYSALEEKMPGSADDRGFRFDTGW